MAQRIVGLLCLALVLVVAACHGGAPYATPPPATAASASQAPPTITSAAPAPTAVPPAPTPEPPGTSPEVEAPAALTVTAELPWEPLYAGDPLRVVVRLSSPVALREMYDRQVAAEEGQPTPTPAEVPTLPATWTESLALTLYRLDAAGTRRPIVSGNAWQPYRRPQPADLPGAPVRTQEWLLPPEAASLAEGEYLLEAAWGDPPLRAESRFAVQPAADGEAAAIHAGRLARSYYLQGDYARARDLGRQSLEQGLEDLSPERLETRFLVAGCSLALKDYAAAREAYQELQGLAPEGSDVAELAAGWLALVGELEQAEAPTAAPGE